VNFGVDQMLNIDITTNVPAGSFFTSPLPSMLASNGDFTVNSAYFTGAGDQIVFDVQAINYNGSIDPAPAPGPLAAGSPFGMLLLACWWGIGRFQRCRSGAAVLF
jgi:hypothetical protein